MKKLFVPIMVLALMVSSFGTVWAHAEDSNDHRTEYLERVQDLREQHEAKRQEQIVRIQEIRAEKLAEREEKRVQIRAELEERFTERAKERAERVAGRLNAVNDNVTDAMLNHLNAIENSLEALVSRINRITEGSEADLATSLGAIDSAYARITFAKEAVMAQKEKVYTIEIDSIEGAGSAFREVANQLKVDLRALMANELRPAREAIRTVFSELKSALAEARGNDHDDDDDDDDDETEV